MPTDGLADRVSDVGCSFWPEAGQYRPGSGCKRWSCDRLHRTRPSDGLSSVGDKPRRVKAPARSGDWCTRGLRIRSSPSRSGRRRHGRPWARRPGNTGQMSEARRHDRHLWRHERAEPTGPADPHLLPNNCPSWDPTMGTLEDLQNLIVLCSIADIRPIVAQQFALADARDALPSLSPASCSARSFLTND